MTAIAYIRVEEARDILKLPNAALRYLPPGARQPKLENDSAADRPAGLPAIVWIVGENGKPQAVGVRTGAPDNRYTALLKGPLQAGDRLIIGDRSDIR